MQILELLATTPSPRITEQDAREIARSAVEFMFKVDFLLFDNWFQKEGRELLNNLNGDKND